MSVGDNMTTQMEDRLRNRIQELELENFQLKQDAEARAIRVAATEAQNEQLRKTIEDWSKKIERAMTVMELAKSALCKEGVSDAHRATVALLHLGKIP